MQDKFAMFAELEKQLRDALNAPPPPRVNKTALKKLNKKALQRKRAFQTIEIFRPPVAYVRVSCRKPWGGKLEYIDYYHTNCSLFEAELEVDRIIRANNWVKHCVLYREVRERDTPRCQD